MIGRSQSELRCGWLDRWAASGPPGIGSTQLIAREEDEEGAEGRVEAKQNNFSSASVVTPSGFPPPIKTLHATPCRVLLKLF